MAEPVAGAPANDRLAEMRDTLATLKRDTAKALAALQVGGQRRVRRELGRQVEACQRRGKALGRNVRQLLDQPETLSDAEKAELELAQVFLTMLETYKPGD